MDDRIRLKRLKREYYKLYDKFLEESYEHGGVFSLCPKCGEAAVADLSEPSLLDDKGGYYKRFLAPLVISTGCEKCDNAFEIDSHDGVVTLHCDNCDRDHPIDHIEACKIVMVDESQESFLASIIRNQGARPYWIYTHIASGELLEYTCPDCNNGISYHNTLAPGQKPLSVPKKLDRIVDQMNKLASKLSEDYDLDDEDEL